MKDMIGVPCYHEYKIAKIAGKLDPYQLPQLIAVLGGNSHLVQ